MSKWELVEAIGLLAYMAFEKWIGNTKKVEANSALDLVFGVLSKIFKRKN